MNWKLKFELNGMARDPVAAVMNSVVPDPFAARTGDGMVFAASSPPPNAATPDPVIPVAGPLDNRPILKLVLAGVAKALADWLKLPTEAR